MSTPIARALELLLGLFGLISLASVIALAYHLALAARSAWRSRGREVRPRRRPGRRVDPPEGRDGGPGPRMLRAGTVPGNGGVS